MEERRKSQRLQKNMPARYKEGKNDSPEASIQDAASENISTGGLKLITFRKLEIGEEINIEVSVDGSINPFYALGKVIWVNEISDSEGKKFEIGIKFKRVVPKTNLKGF